MDKEIIKNARSEFIRNARRKAGLTQKQLASLLFVTDKAVSKWERGLSFPDNSILLKLSSILDLDVEKLLSLQSDDKNDFIKKEKIGQGSGGCTVYLAENIKELLLNKGDSENGDNKEEM